MPHIVKSFDDELARLYDTIVTMGRATRTQFALALDSLTDSGGQTAARIAASDVEIDRVNEEINDQVLRVLALRSPMADDLRLVVTAMQMATGLERIGDYSVGVARHATALSGEPPRSLGSVTRMGKQVLAMLTDVLNAYAERISGAALAGLLAEKLADRGGRIEWGELALVEDAGDRAIGMSFYARWSGAAA